MAYSSSGRGKLDVLLRLTEEEMKSASMEQVVSWSTYEGPERLIALRLAAAKAAMVGRLDLMPYFIEERNVAVQTITAEEEALLDAHYSDCNNDGKRILRFMPHFVAIGYHIEKVVNYLLKWVKKEEVNRADFLGRTCLMAAAYNCNTYAVQYLLDRRPGHPLSNDGHR